MVFSQAITVLEQQKELLRLILSSIGDGVIVADQHGKLLYANSAAEQIHGRELFESAPTQWSTRLGLYESDCVTPLATSDLPLLRALRGELIDDVDIYACRPGASVGTWLSVTSRPIFDRDGAICGAVVVSRDVTARRQSDEQRRALLEVAPDAMVVVNPAGQIVQVNAQTEKMFGYRRDELVGREVECLLPERFRQRHIGQRAEYLAEPRTRAMGNGAKLFGLRDDGAEIPVEIALSTLESNGELLVYAAIRDCSERRAAEAAIQRLNDELEQRVIQRTAELASANRELEQRNAENETFVYTVSHDLRSPLVNLQGFSNELTLIGQDLRDILVKSDLPKDVQSRAVALIDGDMSQAVHFVQSAVLRLSNIIDALLRLSRARRLEYQFQAVDLGSIVERIVDSLSLTISQRAAAVTSEPLPPVWGDATAIEQVFANLIGNALNYLDPNRPGLIEIGTSTDHHTDVNEHNITFYVRDNGLGIPAPYRDKVFRAFQRLHPHAAAGEGMGLAIVQRIIDRHKGRIWFESSENIGTTFYVSLPAALPVSPVGPADNQSRGEPLLQTIGSN